MRNSKAVELQDAENGVVEVLPRAEVVAQPMCDPATAARKGGARDDEPTSSGGSANALLCRFWLRPTFKIRITLLLLK